MHNKLNAALELARTAPAHPFTIADDGERTYSWDCPDTCTHTLDTCPIIHRLRQADIEEIAGHLPAGHYLAQPTLWSVEIIKAPMPTFPGGGF